MLDKIKNLQDHPYVRQLQDVRSLGQLVFVVIVLLISWSGVKVIESNYQLQKQISALQQENTVQGLENNNMQLQNEYYNTPQYLELAARENFGLAAPGEKELVVPKDVALAHTVGPAPSDDANTAAAHIPAYQRNLQAWVNFFLHRQDVTQQ